MKSFIWLAAIAVAAFAAVAGKMSDTALPGKTGTYSALATYNIDSPGPDIGTLTARVRAAKSGRKLKIKLSGIVDPSDTPVPITSTLKFDSKRRVRSNSLLLGYYGALKTEVARFRQKNKQLTFRLKTGSGATILGTPVDGSASYRITLGRRTFLIDGTGFLRPLPSGTPVPFAVFVRATLLK